MTRFSIGAESFELDGQPHQIISGAMHYFRIHPAQWADRIATAKEMGLNTIETYVAWNFHSPVRGTFDLEGRRDLGRFLELVRDAGLHAIVRPGPFICAEWKNGGLPSWLLSTPDIELRKSNGPFLEAVQEYFDALLPIVADMQIDNGGPVLMVQVENEYGAYGDDKEYLRRLVTMIRGRGITVPLFTCDQANDTMLDRGGLPELHKTATFGSRSLQRFEILRRHQPTGPLMCMEYWNGWFDAWGQDHHVTDPEATASDLSELLSSGASLNFYMVHGGTNFGFNNGANDKGNYRPTITSYDYDAPIAEDGSVTEKYMAIQRVIHAHLDKKPKVFAPRREAPQIEIPRPVRGRSLWSFIDSELDRVEFEQVPSHEEIDPLSEFTLYRTEVDLREGGLLDLSEIRDRAQVFCDRKPIGVLDRSEGTRALTLPVGGKNAVLEFLVEDQGRVNYGPRIGELKGLIGPVRLNGREIRGWTASSLPIDNWANSMLIATDGEPVLNGLPGPALYAWNIPAPANTDLFLETSNWSKGVAWFNDWNLGRYWSKGPQETLYVPAPTVQGQNDVLVALELLGAADPSCRFGAGPRWATTTAS